MAGDSSFSTNNPFRRKSAATASSSSSLPADASAPPLSSTSSFPAASAIFLDGDSPSPSSPFQSANSPIPQPPQLSSQPTGGGDDFHQLLRALPKSDAPPPPTTFQKKKPVKKVRVQSPPPSSPESAHAVHAYPKYPRPSRSDDEESTTSTESLSTDRDDDPFGNAPPGMVDDVGFREDEHRIEERQRPTQSQAPPPPVVQGIGQAPPNPFQKTLEDMERGAKDGEQGTAAAKGGMDVDAFRRLLLTGQGPVPAPAVSSPAAGASPPSHLHPTGGAGDAGSITDASSISRQSIFDSAHPPQETPRTSHEISEPEAETERRVATTTKPPPPAARKKPPPPPGSRHGKLIKIELKGEQAQKDTTAAGRPGSSGQSSNRVSSPTERPSSSDINKPLPPAPARRLEDEDRESIFDREAAGKIPELDVDPEADVVPSPRPPTPPNASHSSSTPVQNPASTLRKPAPPPRRQPGHARTDSKPPSIIGIPPPSSVSPTATYADDAEHAPPRSSLDSQRSRSSSIRVNISSAPAPPPPRRPTHGATRAANSFTSPTATSFASAASSVSATSPSALSDPNRSPMGSFAGAQHAHSHLADAIGSGGEIAAAATSPGANIPSSVSAPHIPHSASQPKLFPPPPPPARNSSVRVPGASGRPPSVSSFDATSRRVGREAGGSAPPPPPPRPRTRGGSKGSVDAPGLGARRTSVDSVRVMGGKVVEEPGAIAAGEEADQEGQGQGRPRSQTQDSAANDILADLDALQREVDAARAMFGK